MERVKDRGRGSRIASGSGIWCLGGGGVRKKETVKLSGRVNIRLG